MSMQRADILQEALQLSEPERALLVDELLSSLHATDPRIDALWIQEADRRMAAYDAGEIKAIPAEEVLAEFDCP